MDHSAPEQSHTPSTEPKATEISTMSENAGQGTLQTEPSDLGHTPHPSLQAADPVPEPIAAIEPPEKNQVPAVRVPSPDWHDWIPPPPTAKVNDEPPRTAGLPTESLPDEEFWRKALEAAQALERENAEQAQLLDFFSPPPPPPKTTAPRKATDSKSVAPRSEALDLREQLVDRREREFERRDRELDRRERELERRERELERRQREFEQERTRAVSSTSSVATGKGSSAASVPLLGQAIERLRKQLERDLVAERKKAETREAELERRVMKKVTEALENERQVMRMSDNEVHDMVNDTVGYLLQKDEDIADRVRFQSLLHLSQEKLAAEAGLALMPSSESIAASWRMALGPSVVTEDRYNKALELLKERVLDPATNKLIESKPAMQYVVEYTSHLRKEGAEMGEHGFAPGRISREAYLESVARQANQQGISPDALVALVDFICPPPPLDAETKTA